jgi:hypothetical protein
MAKAIICGADLVAVDVPLLVALGCKVCGPDGNGGAARQGRGSGELSGAADGAEACPAEIAGEQTACRATNR